MGSQQTASRPATVPALDVFFLTYFLLEVYLSSCGVNDSFYFHGANMADVTLCQRKLKNNNGGGGEKININPSAKSFSYQKAEVKEGWIQSFRDQLFYSVQSVWFWLLAFNSLICTPLRLFGDMLTAWELALEEVIARKLMF